MSGDIGVFFSSNILCISLTISLSALLNVNVWFRAENLTVAIVRFQQNPTCYCSDVTTGMSPSYLAFI